MTIARLREILNDPEMRRHDAEKVFAFDAESAKTEEVTALVGPMDGGGFEICTEIRD